MALPCCFAAIDIGSNAVRLLITRVSELEDKELLFRKEVWVRMPVRLGGEAFSRGDISAQTVDMLMHTLQGYGSLISAMRPAASRCVATSALRDANNSAQICRAAKQRGINIEIITGADEARLVSYGYAEKQGNCLFADVGGGSTDIALVTDGHLKMLHSFQIGTLRPPKSNAEQYQQLRECLGDIGKREKSLQVIASGGNINKVFTLTADKHSLIRYDSLKHLLKTLQPMSTAQRIARYHFRPDRADTITVALSIFIEILKALGIDSLKARKYGLADGVISDLYHQHINR